MTTAKCGRLSFIPDKRADITTQCYGGAGGKPVETMSLNFTKIEWQITAEKSDGAQQESRTSVWDLAMDQIGNDDDANHSGRAIRQALG